MKRYDFRRYGGVLEVVEDGGWVRFEDALTRIDALVVEFQRECGELREKLDNMTMLADVQGGRLVEYGVELQLFNSDGEEVSPGGFLAERTKDAVELETVALEEKNEKLQDRLTFARLQGGCDLAIALGCSTGHADTFDALVAEVGGQIEKLRVKVEELRRRLALREGRLVGMGRREWQEHQMEDEG